jgi:rhomboid protease GluP
MEDTKVGAYGRDSQDSGAPSYSVSFSAPGPSRWFAAQSKTRWHWTGDGQLGIEDSDIVMRGHRARTFWFSAPQEIRVPIGEVIDVSVTDRRVSFSVNQTYGAAEAVSLWASNAEVAAAIAAQLPKTKSAQFQEHMAFAESLASLNARVVVTPALIGINVAVFVAMVASGISFMNPTGAALIHWGSNYGPLTLSGQWWRLFTSMFLHFGAFHILFNMWAFWNLGPLAERLFGSPRFLLLYLFAGLCGSEASLLWNSAVNSAGASGAIFGVLGGLLAFMLNPKTKIPASVSANQRNSALIFIAYNLFNGFTHAGIDNASHIGGLVGGMAMGWLLSQPLEAHARLRPWPGLLTGLGAAVIVLLGLGWPLYHPSAATRAHVQFSRGFYLYSLQEADALARSENLRLLLSNHQISDQQWGMRTLAEVLPVWSQGAATVSDIVVPTDSSYYGVKTALSDYLEHFQSALRDGAEAARDNDNAKSLLSQDEFKQVLVLQKQVIELLKANP